VKLLRNSFSESFSHKSRKAFRLGLLSDYKFLYTILYIVKTISTDDVISTPTWHFQRILYPGADY